MRTAHRWPFTTICLRFTSLYFNAPVAFQMLYNNNYVITFYPSAHVYLLTYQLQKLWEEILPIGFMVTEQKITHA